MAILNKQLKDKTLKADVRSGQALALAEILPKIPPLEVARVIVEGIREGLNEPTRVAVATP